MSIQYPANIRLMPEVIHVGSKSSSVSMMESQAFPSRSSSKFIQNETVGKNGKLEK